MRRTAIILGSILLLLTHTALTIFHAPCLAKTNTSFRLPPSSGRHTLVIPSGGDDLSGWTALRDCIRRVAAHAEAAGAGGSGGDAAAAAAPPPLLPDASQQPPGEQQQQQQQQQQRGGAGGEPPPPSHPHPPHPPPPVDVAHAATVGPDHGPPTLSPGPGGAPVLTAAGRRTIFDVGAAPRGGGRFMRITQVAAHAGGRGDRASIVVPAAAVPQFRAAVGAAAELLEARAREDAAAAASSAAPAPSGAAAASAAAAAAARGFGGAGGAAEQPLQQQQQPQEAGEGDGSGGHALPQLPPSL